MDAVCARLQVSEVLAHSFVLEWSGGLLSQLGRHENFRERSPGDGGAVRGAGEWSVLGPACSGLVYIYDSGNVVLTWDCY